MAKCITLFVLACGLAFSQTAPVATCNAASVNKVAQTVNTGAFAGTGSSWRCVQLGINNYSWTLTGSFQILQPNVPVIAWQAAGGPAGVACSYANQASSIYAWQANLYQCGSGNTYVQTTGGGGGSPGAPTNSVQTNNGSGGFAGTSNFLYASNVLTLANVSAFPDDPPLGYSLPATTSAFSAQGNASNESAFSFVADVSGQDYWVGIWNTTYSSAVGGTGIFSVMTTDQTTTNPQISFGSQCIDINPLSSGTCIGFQTGNLIGTGYNYDVVGFDEQSISGTHSNIGFRTNENQSTGRDFAFLATGTAPSSFTGPVNLGSVLSATDGAIASASTIAPTTPIVTVSGTATINNITPQTGCTTSGTDCYETLIASGAWSFGTSGNIASALTAVSGSAYTLVYQPSTTKWHLAQSGGGTIPNTPNLLIGGASNTAGNSGIAPTGAGITSTLSCIAASASGTAYTCTTSPSFTPVTGSAVNFKADIANIGTSATLAVDGAAAAGIKIAGSTTLTVGQVLASTFYVAVYDGTNWQLVGGGGNTTSTGLVNGNLPCATSANSLADCSLGIAAANVVTTTSGINVTSALASGTNRWALPNWRLAIAKVLTGTSDAKLMLLGDSTTFGYQCASGGSYDVNVCSYPAKLATLLNTRGITSAQGVGIAPISPTLDGRWTVGSGWTQASNFAFVSSWEGITPGNLVFTPNASGVVSTTYDKFDVYYINSTSGTMTITPTGSTATVVNITGTNFILKTTVTALVASTSNTVTITCSATCFVAAIEPYLSTANRVRVSNFGVTGSTSTQWATNTNGYYPISAIKDYAPNLTVISLGINDAGGALSSGTFSTNMQAIITAAKVSGDVIILGFPPSQTTPWTTNEPAYIPVLKSLAASNNVPFIDTWDGFNATWQTLFMADGLHPNAAGYWDMASALDAFLTTINN